MAFEFNVAIAPLAGALDTLRRYPSIVEREVVRLLQSRGLPSLRAAVPVATGRLRGSFRMRVRGGAVQIESTDPAAEWIKYKRPGAYGARTVQGTMSAWARAELPGIIRDAVRVAESRIARGSR